MFSTILGNWDEGIWDERVSKKRFGLVLMFPCLKRQSKAENNKESTNNLKLWLLNILRNFLLRKIIVAR